LYWLGSTVSSLFFCHEPRDDLRHEFHESTRIKPRVVVRLVTIREISVSLLGQATSRFFRSADRRGAGPRPGTVSRRHSSASTTRREHVAQLPVVARQAPCRPPTLL